MGEVLIQEPSVIFYITKEFWAAYVPWLFKILKSDKIRQYGKSYIGYYKALKKLPRIRTGNQTSRMAATLVLNYLRAWDEHLCGFIDLVVNEQERNQEYKKIVTAEVEQELRGTGLDFDNWVEVYHEATGNVFALDGPPEIVPKKKSVKQREDTTSQQQLL